MSRCRVCPIRVSLWSVSYDEYFGYFKTAQKYLLCCATLLQIRYGICIFRKIKKGEENEKCDFNIYDAAYNR